MTETSEVRFYASTAPVGALGVLIMGHGAGAGQSSPWMIRVAKALAGRGFTTVTFDFPYMAAGRRVPDRAPALEASWRETIEEVRARTGALPLFIGGKSMGGRIASHIAAQRGGGALAGLVCFGYPLHPPGKPEQRRDAHLPAIAEPVLFIQGSRDPFGTAADIRALLPSMPDATLHGVAGGDHSLNVPARDRKGLPDPLDTALDAAAAWMAAHAS